MFLGRFLLVCVNASCSFTAEADARFKQQLDEQYLHAPGGRRVPQVVLCLTTTPQRLARGLLKAALEGTFRQSFVPDRVVVALPRGRMRRRPSEVYPEDTDLPRYLLQPLASWQDKFVLDREIEDQGPITSVMCLLKHAAEKNSIILGFADDVFLSQHHFATVIFFALSLNGFAVAPAGRLSIPGMRPCFSSYDFQTGCAEKSYFGQTFGPITLGYLVQAFRPWFFGKLGLISAHEAEFPECAMHDDLWLAAVMAARGIRRMSFNGGLPGQSLINAKELDLWSLRDGMQGHREDDADTLFCLDSPTDAGAPSAVSNFERSLVALQNPVGRVRVGFVSDCKAAQFADDEFLEVTAETWSSAGGYHGKRLAGEMVYLRVEGGEVRAFVGELNVASWRSMSSAMCAKVMLLQPGTVLLLERTQSSSTSLFGGNHFHLIECSRALTFRVGHDLWKPRPRLVLMLPTSELDLHKSSEATLKPRHQSWLDSALNWRSVLSLGEAVRCAGHLDDTYLFNPSEVVSEKLSARSLLKLVPELQQESDQTVVLAIFWDNKTGLHQMPAQACMQVSQVLQCAMSQDLFCAAEIPPSKARATAVPSPHLTLIAGSLRSWRSGEHHLDFRTWQGTPKKALPDGHCWRGNSSWGTCCGPQLLQLDHGRKGWLNRVCKIAWQSVGPGSCCFVHPNVSRPWLHLEGKWNRRYEDGRTDQLIISDAGLVQTMTLGRLTRTLQLEETRLPHLVRLTPLSVSDAPGASQASSTGPDALRNISANSLCSVEATCSTELLRLLDGKLHFEHITMGGELMTSIAESVGNGLLP
ncbi:unnamed protein product [Polarella glacialis]|uniref:Uncharacterized protein n=2 Tax=Polarella glacialis TaxID=89957 RepID=A0A813IDZ1_POLGL|nr:unnamed protein product [Polarella glacialis]